MLCRLLILALAGQGVAVRAEEAIPTAFTRDRYESLRARSPFALATTAVATAPQASFAANWYVTGVARIGDDNFVTIKSRDLATQFTLFGNEPVGGVTVASVNWSDQVGKSTVVLCKGTETARLEFNEAQWRMAVAAPVATTAKPGINSLPVAKEESSTNARGIVVQGEGTAVVSNNSGPLRRRKLPIPVPR